MTVPDHCSASVPTGTLEITGEDISLVLPAGCEDLMVEVYLGGRRIWTTRTSRGWWGADGRWHLPWPAAQSGVDR